MPRLTLRSARGLSRRPVLAWPSLGLALAVALELGCGAALPSMPMVEVTPGTASVQAGGGSQQFTASVANTSDTKVVWKVNGQMGGNATDGTITQQGLYSAPATVPAGAVEVQAYSVANANVVGTATVSLRPGVTISISPATATVDAGTSLQFSATVTNAQDTSVTWSVNGTKGGSASLGTISSTGLYTAPSSFPGLNGVTVTAASNADSSATASAAVTLSQPVGVTLSPATATVNVGQTQAFTASVSGSSNQGVHWSINGVAGGNATLGTISAQGVFTAPAAVPSPATETLVATSAADPTKSADAALTIGAPLGISISPQTASAKANQTVQFTASVSNTDNTSVTWSVNGTKGGSATVGTISTGGLYTAPATFPGLDQVSITVTSVADPNLSASATLKLVQPVSVAVAPATATINLGAAQTFAATVTGSTNQDVSWSVNGVAGGNSTLGTINQQGVFTAPAKLPATAQETITATSEADTSESASAQITLQTPPQQFTLSPSTSSLTLQKAQSGSVTLQLGVSDGFSGPIAFSVTGLPPNVTSAVSPDSATASGPIQVKLTTGSISLAAKNLPVTVTATASSGGATVVQSATVLLTIGGWAGQVSTLAGGPGGVGYQDGSGTTDELNATAVVSDGANTLYFADKRGNALRTYGLQSQTVTTLFGGPYTFAIGEGDGIAYDPSNQTVYVADALRNRILAYAAGSGDHYTVLAGSGDAGHADGAGTAATFSYPHGLALSPDGATLYVADTGNQLIRAVNVSTGAVTTIAGQYGVYNATNGTGTAATFCEPTGMAIDPTGADLYVSDVCSGAKPFADIRQIALPSLAVTTVAGSPSAVGQTDGSALQQATFLDPRALAVDPHAGAGLVYIADGNEIRALRLDPDDSADASVFTLAGSPSPGQADGSGSAAGFYNPGGLATLSVGSGATEIFVADADNGLLREIVLKNPAAADATTAELTVSTLAGQPSHRGGADGVGTGADYTGTSVAEFSQPEGIVTDDQTAYVADSENAAIRKIDLATSQVTTVAGGHEGFQSGSVPAAQAEFFEPAGLAWVPSQNVIYIADTGNAAIRELNLSNGTVTTVAGTNASGSNDPSTPVSAQDARFNHPYGVLASPDGSTLYVADTGNNEIRKIDLGSGEVSVIAGSGALGWTDGTGTAARFSEPNGLAFDAGDKNIFISDFENDEIRELNLATGAVTTLVGKPHVCGHQDGPAASATLCDPAFIATDGRSLFWGDANTGLLRVLNLQTMVVSTLAGSPGVLHMADGSFTEKPGELTGPVLYNGVFGLAVAPNDAFILFTDKTANVVRIIH